MSNNWEYGGAYKKYEFTDNTYTFEDGSIIKVHDIFDELPEFVYQADCIFVDPPWNKSNLSTFYTKADKINLNEYKDFYKRLFECIKNINPKICFVEVGKEHLADFIIEMRKIYKYVTFYNSTYYYNKSNLCYIIQGCNKRINYKLDVMDEEDIIKWICENIDYNCICDLCMGRGLVGYYSNKNNKKFIGTELNYKRLAVLIERIKEGKKKKG